MSIVHLLANVLSFLCLLHSHGIVAYFRDDDGCLLPTGHSLGDGWWLKYTSRPPRLPRHSSPERRRALSVKIFLFPDFRLSFPTAHRFPQFGSESHFGGEEGVIDVSGRSGADEGGGDIGVSHRPGHGKTHHGQSHFLGFFA